MKRAHLYISGRVQGVFFRANTREKAQMYGLKGWVKNLPDGRVEVLAQGEKEKLEKLITWCHSGPPSASVTNVEVNWEKPDGNFDRFEIRY